MSKEEKTERSRSWLITAPADGEFAYSREEITDALETYDAYAGQLEEGETGYRHWQILLENREPVRFSTLRRKLPHSHLEPRRGSVAQALAYVTKDDSRVEDEPRLEKGTIRAPEQGRRTDLEGIRERILSSELSLNQLLLELPHAASHVQMCRALIDARDSQRWGNTTRDVHVSVLYGATGTGKTRAIYQDRAFSEVYRVTHYGPGSFDG